MMKTVAQILESRCAQAEEAMHVFDSLDAVTTDFMSGRWRGFEIATGHPMDGLLDLSGWYGKVFVDPENIYPLVFYTHDRKNLFAGDLERLVMSGDIAVLRKAPEQVRKKVEEARTHDSKARVRRLEHRGVVTAAMIYDELPINDIFRKIDDNRVLGVMDLKNVPAPYVFVLERDNDSRFAIDI